MRHSRVDRREVLRLREQILTLIRLDHLAKIHAVQAPLEKKKNTFVIVIGAAERRFGLVVDSLVGEEELVIKALPTEIISSDLVSGASILGDGTVVLILNVPAVLSRLSRTNPGGHRMNERVRVLVVDDSALMRKLIPAILSRDPEIEVVGTAMDGSFALRKIEELHPDVVTLDLEMPRMDGMETLSLIMRRAPMPVILLSTPPKEGASFTLKALALGAVDFIAKPHDAASGNLDSIAAALIEKIKVAKRAAGRKLPAVSPVETRTNARKTVRPASPARRVIAIGISTGGP